MRAKDGGRKGALQSTCKIYVTVGDVNDNSPIVLNPQLDNVSIYATILRDDVILQVQVIRVFFLVVFYSYLDQKLLIPINNTRKYIAKIKFLMI